jgi:hypothetical protein
MAVNLQQIKNVGQATALDIKQFAFAGIPIYQLLADATHKNVSEVKDMKITYDLLSDALEKASQKGGMFAGATKNAAGSMEQVTSNLKEAIGTFASDILQETGIFDLMKKGMLGFTDFLNNAKGPTVSFFKSFKDGIESISKNDLTSKIGQGLSGLTNLAVKGQYSDNLMKSMGLSEDSQMVQSIQNIRTSVFDLSQSFVNLFNTLTPLAEKLKPLFLEILNVLTLTFQSTINLVVQMIPYIINGFTLVIDTITNLINFVASLPVTITNAFNTIITFFTSLPY